jgi:hypothetical protein
MRVTVQRPITDVIAESHLSEDEAHQVQKRSIEKRFSDIVEMAVSHTMIPTSLLGMDFRLILSVVYSAGRMQLILQCPSGGIEGIKEWSSDVLQNFRTARYGRQKVILV